MTLRPYVAALGVAVLLAVSAGAVAIFAQDETVPPPPKETPSEAPKDAPSETPKDAPSETPKETPGDAPKDEPKETPKVEGPAPKSPGGSIVLPRAPLLKENTRLIDIEGLILDLKADLKVGDVSRAVFQPKDGLGYFILLENTLLQKTLAVTAHGERPVRVRGTITVFNGRNYLMLDYAAVKQE